MTQHAERSGFAPRDFVHLHLHTDYSLLQSTIQLKPLAKRLVELDQKSCAITDYGNLYGAVSFFNVMSAAGIKPIIGYEAFLRYGSRFDRSTVVESGDIVDAIEEHENLCNWVHLPVQSGSDRVLAGMKRGHTADKYLRKIDRLRSSSRDISLTTDIIVGFPGETEEDFQETVRLVEYCGFDAAYIFKYSPRPGTPAFDMADDVSLAEKTLRFMELERVQKQSQERRLQRYLNRSVSVLVEGGASRTEGGLTGHSTCHKVLNFKGAPDLLGRIVDVRVTALKPNSLFGEVL